jgi:hypothetical protein
MKSRRMKWAGHACRSLVEKREVKRLLGRPRHKWKNNTKMDLREIEWDCMDWIDLAQNREQWKALSNTVINLRVP